MYLGDFNLEKSIHCMFTTRAFATGVPTTLAGTPAVEIYEDNSTTQITAAETLTVDFDAVTGLNHLLIAATAANGFEAGKFYHAVISAGTVSSVSVVGEVVASFSIQAGCALRPTTADRTLDVSAGGEAGLDWANIGSPTTAQNLSATNIDVDQIVASVSGAVGSVTGAVGSVTGAVGSVAAGGITAASIATDAIDGDAIAATAVSEIQSGLATSAEVAAVQADTDDIQARLPAALVGGRMDSSVGAMAANTMTAAATAADMLAEINAEVVDALNVDTYAEIGQETPAATQTIRKMLAYLYKAWRNKSDQTSSTYRLYGDDATTVDQKSSVSDDGTTYTSGEKGTGP